MWYASQLLLPPITSQFRQEKRGNGFKKISKSGRFEHVLVRETPKPSQRLLLPSRIHCEFDRRVAILGREFRWSEWKANAWRRILDTITVPYNFQCLQLRQDRIRFGGSNWTVRKWKRGNLRPSIMLYAEEAQAILLLTHGPWKPNRIDMFEAGRLFRMRGTKNGLSLIVRETMNKACVPFSCIEQVAGSIDFVDISDPRRNENTLYLTSLCSNILCDLLEQEDCLYRSELPTINK